MEYCDDAGENLDVNEGHLSHLFRTVLRWNLWTITRDLWFVNDIGKHCQFGINSTGTVPQIPDRVARHTVIVTKP